MAEHAARTRRRLALAEAVASYEAEFGAFSEAELAAQRLQDQRDAIVRSGGGVALAKPGWPVHWRASSSTAKRRAGPARGLSLLAVTGQRDVIDAALALLAEHGDIVFSSDPGDLAPLLEAAGQHVELVTV
jgi:hypothetical protein